jgi:hypothetical protein
MTDPAEHPETAREGDERCSNVACTLREGHGGGCVNPAIDPPDNVPTYTTLRIVREYGETK